MARGTARHRVAIVGGGFGGLFAARVLGRARDVEGSTGRIIKIAF